MLCRKSAQFEKSKKKPAAGLYVQGVDDVMNALQPLLVKYKVFIVPEVLEQTREERTTKKWEHGHIFGLQGQIHILCR